MDFPWIGFSVAIGNPEYKKTCYQKDSHGPKAFPPFYWGKVGLEPIADAISDQQQWKPGDDGIIDNKQRFTFWDKLLLMSEVPKKSERIFVTDLNRIQKVVPKQ